MKVVCSVAGVFALALVATVAINLWPELTQPKHVDLALQIPSPARTGIASDGGAF
jgi:hypothetical protein